MRRWHDCTLCCWSGVTTVTTHDKVARCSDNLQSICKVIFMLHRRHALTRSDNMRIINGHQWSFIRQHVYTVHTTFYRMIYYLFRGWHLSRFHKSLFLEFNLLMSSFFWLDLFFWLPDFKGNFGLITRIFYELYIFSYLCRFRVK